MTDVVENKTVEAKVSVNSRVLVHFSVMLPDGSAADSTRVEGKPALFVLGNDSLSEGLEKALIGKCVGERFKVELGHLDAFGPSNPDLIRFFEVKDFPQDLALEEGLIISFDQPNGNQLPGVVKSIAAESVKVDFNHPLAGQDVIFDIEILEIKPQEMNA